MIVMSCAARDRLSIGEDVHVDILEVQSDYVRLAITTTSPIPGYSEETIYLRDCEPAELLA